MTRGKLLAIILTPTLLIGLGVGGYLLYDASQKREKIEVADKAALDYQEKHDFFRSELGGQFAGVDYGDPTSITQTVDTAKESVPELKKVSAYGAENSEPYQRAQELKEKAEADLSNLDGLAEQAEKSKAFVDAANKALEVDPTSFVTERTLPNGDAIRKRMIPPLKRNLSEFESVEAPDDASEARSQVVDALEYVISSAESGARRLDSGQNYRLEYGTQYGRARLGVLTYSADAEASIREAFDKARGDESGGGGEQDDQDDGLPGDDDGLPGGDGGDENQT